MTSNTINLVGEFYAMSRLFLHGYEATLTLGNTKGVDILLLNPKTNKTFKVEVKTSTSIFNEKIFGGKNYSWVLNEKHEGIKDENLVYCFVFVYKGTEDYKIFFVPSKDVAEYSKWEHGYWLNAEHKKPVKDTPMRNFRIRIGEKSHYENNFSIFE